MDLIKGKVAAIKGEDAVVINKGYKDGVEENMRFIIYENGEEIFDPDTQESLGNLEYIKGKVKVRYPGEKISVAEPYETNIIPGTEWLLFAKKSRKDPIVIMDAQAFFKLLQKNKGK